MCCFLCDDCEILLRCRLGINHCYRRLHNRMSRIEGASHPPLHQCAIHEQEELVGEHLWLLRTCLHSEITKTCTHGLFELESNLMCRMFRLGELNDSLQT